MVDLSEYLETCDRKFDWQNNNCCHFASRWVELKTGIDPMLGLPRTASMRSALALIRSLGGDLVDAWSARLGLTPVSEKLARSGDIVRIMLPHGREAVGICSGRHAVFLSDEEGLVYVPIEGATHAWRLP